jgi:hypothetical protein
MSFTLGRVTLLSKRIPSVRSEIGMAARKAFLTTKCFWSSVIVVMIDFGRSSPSRLLGAGLHGGPVDEVVLSDQLRHVIRLGSRDG